MVKKNFFLIITSSIILIVLIFFGYNKYKYNSILNKLNSYNINVNDETEVVVLPRDVREIKQKYNIIQMEYQLFKQESLFLFTTLNISFDENKYLQDDYKYMKDLVKENEKDIQKNLNVLASIFEDNEIQNIVEEINSINLENINSYIYCTNKIIELYGYILINYTIEDIIKEVSTDVHLGFVYWNPTTDEIIKQNENEIFLAASTYKLGVALQIADGVNSGKYNLNDKVNYKSIDYEGGAGIIQYQPYGTSYTVDELLQIMIHYSDNVAAHMLIRYIGEDNYQSFMDVVTNNSYTFDGNEITPQAGFCLVKKLYVNEEENQIYEDIISYMENTVYEDRISLYLDNDIVAHKIGDYGMYTNDIGVIYGNSPFVVSYYCQGVSEACKQTIGEMSYIFNYYTAVKNKF